ncbi:4'-phosphopantetheinyl transferase superfamily protein [Bradyrhizobium erythrophlei]|uniref:4'-phosphopantetheinyl transferase superfamily protein n=1 Tax=Bradyrhizobium erythrophlei TaxID=1437360 RepID=UPI0035E8ABAF
MAQLSLRKHRRDGCPEVRITCCVRLGVLWRAATGSVGVHRVTGAPRNVHWDRLLFSAKESIFKAWFPLTGAWLGFEDAMVTFTAKDNAFRARLSCPLPHTCGGTRELRGRFMFVDGLIFTAVLV